MVHPHWPLFDLEVRTPRLVLRYVDDELAAELATLAAAGVHDPSWMPFSIPWTDLEPPELQRQAMQYWWQCRASTSPESWELNLAVVVDGAAVGVTSIGAAEFPVLRTFHTGSWLGRSFQGRGLGTEMRAATLHLGFAGFGAERATTGRVRRQRRVARRHPQARLRAERDLGPRPPRRRQRPAALRAHP